MGQGEIKRGKHAKIRKMKEKYGEQDEEDRQRRMALLGAKQVKGFDLVKHQQLKYGSLVTGKKIEVTEESGENVTYGETPIEVDQIEIDKVEAEQVEAEQVEAEQVQADKLEAEVKSNQDAQEESKEDEAEADVDPEGDQIPAEEEDKTKEDLDDEEELAKLIKEEDINIMPENTDVSEIDKLTGIPKGNGKYPIPN